METSNNYSILATGPRAGGRGRRDVSPVWWTTSDETPFSIRDRNPPFLADRAELKPTSFTNRLRRRHASISLSKQYLESGECSTSDSCEPGAVQRQTIPPTVATQDDTDRTNYRASRLPQLSSVTNQLRVVKISSGSRGASAQTAATTTQASSVCKDTVDGRVQQNGHKTGRRIGSVSCIRSSITSEENASTKRAGKATPNIAPVASSTVLPPHTEFLDFHSSSVRHRSSLLLPARRDFSISQNRIDEQNEPGLNQSFMAKLRRKVSSRAQQKRQAETATPREWHHDEAQLVKIDWLERAGQPSPLYPGSPRDRVYRGNFVLGQAKTVKMTKAGGARLVKVSTKKSPSFNIDSLSSVEADLMSSAGAAARSSRRSSLWTDGATSSGESTPDIRASTETSLQTRGRQQCLTSRTISAEEQHRAVPSEQLGGHVSGKSGPDERFRELVRRLETHHHESSQGTGHALVQELSRVDPQREAASEQHSAISSRNGRCGTRRTQVSALEHKPGYFCLNDPTKRRAAVDDGVMLTSASKIPAIPNSHPGASGCPSLISDDGRELSDIPGDTTDDDAQTPTFHMPSGISDWEKEETSTASNGIPSEESLTLVNMSMDENELSSGADADVDEHDDAHSDENTSSCGGHGWWYREPRAVASPLSFHHDSFHSRLRQGRQRGTSTITRQPDELDLYHQCAILRWLISTTDAPGTRGMRDESSAYWEPLELPHEYLPRYGDEARAQIWRVLRFLSDPEEPRPELSQEARAFLREIYPQSMPPEEEDSASVTQSLPLVDAQQPRA